jgi:hypothetical protein
VGDKLAEMEEKYDLAALIGGGYGEEGEDDGESDSDSMGAEEETTDNGEDF